MAIWRRHLGAISGLILVLAIVAVGFIPRAMVVDTAAVARGTLRVTVEEEGRTRVIDRFVVSAPVAGFLRRVELNVGDPVTRGEVVAFLEPLRSTVLDPRSRAEAESRVAATRAAMQASRENVVAADADAKYAAAELARLERLHEKKTVSLEALQQGEANARRTKAALQSAQFNVQVAQFELKAAEAALSYSAAEGSAAGGAPETVAITAPVAGRVLRIDHESEGVVAAGEDLLELGDPLSLEVEVEVLSRDAVRIRPGSRVQFDQWGGDELLEGAVRNIEPVGFTKVSALGVEEQRVLVIADITSPAEKWNRLGDGYRVDANFILWEGNSVLNIPTSALFRNQDSWNVFIALGGRAVRREVTVGRRGGLVTEIVSGLQEGETVIVHPADKLVEGNRVRAR
ncbi:MAG: efflux RND transporter periplasmic adaptor subunit [Gammaproteobacteria bacterium]|nr:efflux RND transporter periplasmic adaptor subunit [Gammaproteobacteria bacterium]